jgi:hypothetical protein
MNKSTALHEILAVEKSLQTTTERLCVESKKTFKKSDLFRGTIRTLEMFNSEDTHLNTSDQHTLSTTVDENLNYLVGPVANYWNVVLRKDMANTVAEADIIVDDVVLFSKVPATFLLGFEKKLRDMREVYNGIPTLPPGRKWLPSPTERDGVFMDVNDQVQFKSQNNPEFRIVAEATEQHPAQVTEVARTVNVGKFTTTETSGMMTPLAKAERLDRIDKLINATKRARMRANKVTVPIIDNFGKTVLNFING